MLVEFTSVVNAVACAAEIQKGMRLRNAHIPEERRIQFRIGINVGDVIVDDTDIFGGGVNIAARLEGIAEPNGISVSAAVRDYIGDRLGLDLVDTGEQHLKNIDRPVRVYRVATGELVPPAGPRHDSDSTAGVERRKPLIAVLPFLNMSGDPEQEYFADGMTEDVITDLSKISGPSVIARHSTFTFNGRSVDVGEVRTKFNASNVLEGSVRKSGSRVRINAQLVDAVDGTHLWAERYDRDLSDIFLVQDEITQNIVNALKVLLLPAESEAIRKATTNSSEAYQFYLRGRHYLSHHSLKAYESADRMFMKSIEIDPSYARAYAGAADCHAFRCMNNADVSVEHILELCAKALELDPDLPEAHASRGLALSVAARYDEATAEFEHAITLDPSSFEAHYFYGRCCVLQGRIEEAADYFRRATEIAPDDFQAYGNLSQQYWALGRLDDAAEVERLCLERAERELDRHPDNVRAVCYGALSLTILGETKRAREWAERALWLEPDDTQVLYNVASTFSLLGDYERSIEILQRCLPRMHPQMTKWAFHDRDLAPLRGDPRFVELLSRVEAGK